MWQDATIQWDVAAWCHRAQGTEIFLIPPTSKMFLAINVEGKVYKGNKHACSNLTAQGCFPSPLGRGGDRQDRPSGCFAGQLARVCSTAGCWCFQDTDVVMINVMMVLLWHKNPGVLQIFSIAVTSQPLCSHWSAIEADARAGN